MYRNVYTEMHVIMPLVHKALFGSKTMYKTEFKHVTHWYLIAGVESSNTDLGSLGGFQR